MEYQIFLVLAPFSIGILSVAGVIVYRNRKSSAARILLFYFIFVTGYLLLNISELLLKTPEETLWAAKIGHFFFSMLPVLWLRFALEYIGNKRFKSKKYFCLFCIVPFLTNLFIHTNTLHLLIWKEISYFTVENYLTMTAVYGPWMWFYGVYNNVLYFTGAFLILQATFGAKKIYWKQSLFIAVGALIPMLFNIIYAFRLLPFLRKDFTSISFTVTAVLGYIGITRFQLIRTLPVARSRIVQELSTAVIVLDSSDNLLDFNHSAADIMGLSDSCLGRKAEDLEGLKPFLSALKETAGGSNSSAQVESGGLIFNIKKDPLFLSQGAKEGALLTVIDITREILLLREKTYLSENLKQKNRELRDAQDIIIQQEKLATIGQLTAGIAHEMNNPLSFVKSNFYSINHYLKEYIGRCGRNEKGDTETEEHIYSMLKDMEEGTDRVIAIIKDLLKFSRPVTKEDEKLYNLNKGLETSLMMMGNELKYIARIEKNLGDIPNVEARENEINQVIINLISNASHAMKLRKEKEGEIYTPALSISTWDDPVSVFCEIENNGLPIPQKDLSSIFMPFFTTKKSSEGTGLGLTIVKEIIEGRYNGSIRAETGTKTRFIFQIPIKNQNRKPAQEKEQDIALYKRRKDD